MADYSRDYSSYHPMEIFHYPSTVEDVKQARWESATDERDWTLHKIDYTSDRLISDICDRILALEGRVHYRG